MQIQQILGTNVEIVKLWKPRRFQRITDQPVTDEWTGGITSARFSISNNGNKYWRKVFRLEQGSR